jgi:hypothetical protein
MPDFQEALALTMSLAAGRPVGMERVDLLDAFHRVSACLVILPDCCEPILTTAGPWLQTPEYVICHEHV